MALPLYVPNTLQCTEGKGMWKLCSPMNFAKHLFLSLSSPEHFLAPCLMSRFNDLHTPTLQVLLPYVLSPQSILFPRTSSPLYFPTRHSQTHVEFSSNIPSSMKLPSSRAPFTPPKMEVIFFSTELLWHFICNTLVADITI